jgi:hypothetical protein
MRRFIGHQDCGFPQSALGRDLRKRAFGAEVTARRLSLYYCTQGPSSACIFGTLHAAFLSWFDRGTDNHELIQ